MSCYCGSKGFEASIEKRPTERSLVPAVRCAKIRRDVLQGFRSSKEKHRDAKRSRTVSLATSEISSENGGDDGGGVAAEPVVDGSPPWSFGFQCNERYLDWDDSAQRRLVQLVASEKLGISLEELTDRVAELGVLLPDMVTKLARMKADLLVKLLASPSSVSEKMIVLREELPDADVSTLVSRFPYLIAEFSSEEIRDRLGEMRRTLEGVDLASLLTKEPRLFSVDMDRVLQEITRLMGEEIDPVSFLVSQPEMVLSMEESGLPSAIDRDS
ncbi:hypothetical protein BSKO_13005 [Bryopsis sp. KO-2023]|nr:hypothetical protein BSKO_13005 [Bryopsis sp. KO-2023]